MTIDRKPRKLFRRRRDELLDRLYEAAKVERRRLADQIAPEFREAVDALEDVDAYQD
jgi:hypothetical protein